MQIENIYTMKDHAFVEMDGAWKIVKLPLSTRDHCNQKYGLIL